MRGIAAERKGKRRGDTKIADQSSAVTTRMMEASGQKEYVVRNCLTYAYVALRSKERLMGNSTTSFYENYFQQLADALSPGKKLDVSVSNSEVESFYLGRVSLGEFRLHNQKR